MNEEMSREDYEQILTWLAGLLAGCAGCEAEAREWAEKVDLKHEVPAELN